SRQNKHMGNGSSSQQYNDATLAPLAPFPYQTGLIKSLCFPYEITLKLKEQAGWERSEE
ncbi:14114_t:CDS:1, partial [Acaulospora colombiana]